MAQNRNLKELEKELESLLNKYNDNESKMYKKKLEQFEKDCIEITQKIFPQFRLPIYVSISEFDNPVPNSLAYWADAENLDTVYSNLNDNYCRDPYKNGGYFYPVRNPSTGVVTLKNCDSVITDELKQMLDLKYELSIMVAAARNALFRSENVNSNNSKTVLEKLNNKLKEYETLQTQYIQTLKLIKNFNMLLKDKTKEIENKEEKQDYLENEYNITRDIENDYNNIRKHNEYRAKQFLFYTKIILFICWCLTLALFSLININEILS
jgi:uncharacterized protein YhaN